MHTNNLHTIHIIHAAEGSIYYLDNIPNVSTELVGEKYVNDMKWEVNVLLAKRKMGLEVRGHDSCLVL